MADLYEYYNTGDTSYFSAHATTWVAQTFTPLIPHEITLVKLKLYRNIFSAEYTIKITTTDEAGYPTDTVLCSTTFDSEPITTESAGQWYEFTFPVPATLTEDIVYAIIIHGVPGEPNPYIYWRADPSAPTYDRGLVYRSTTSGVSWTRYLYDDLMFEEWGEVLVVAPTVTTQAVSDIAFTTAKGHGTITDIGGENASKRGVCWNTTGNPTVADSKSEETDSFGTGAFTRLMTGLTPCEHYYVKAYAYNLGGYGYGGQVEFDTLAVPAPVADGDLIGIGIIRKS